MPTMAKWIGSMPTLLASGSSTVPTMTIAGIRILDALKDVMIMLIPMFVVLALIIMFPQIPLFLPRLFPPGTL